MKIGYYSFVAVLTQVLLSLPKMVAGADDSVCANQTLTNLSEVYLKLELKKVNEHGEWTAGFAALKLVDDSKEPIDLDVQHRIVKCGSRRCHYVRGTLKDADQSSYKMFKEVCIRKLNLRPDPALEQGLPPRINNIPTIKADNLKFYSSGGKNVALTKGGLRAYRTRPIERVGYAGILTDRPLKDNEMFKIKVEKLISEWNYAPVSLGLGVTTLPPNRIKYGEWMPQENVWILHEEGVYFHGKRKADRYGLNLRNLTLGDTVGVVRNSDGNVYFYKNDQDMGLAMWGAPGPVYGVLDLYGEGAMASIVQ